MLALVLTSCSTSPRTHDTAVWVESRADDSPATDDSTADDSAAIDDSGVAAPPLQVYLLAGQSNMDGYAYVSGLPPTLQVTQSDVRLYWSNDAAWTGLDAASFGIYYGVEYFGPEVTFGRAMADHDPTQPVALIKHAVGGTDLAAFWYPGTARDDPKQGPGYSVFLATVDAALADLDAEGTPYEIAGMLWMQGESDAFDESHANAYESNLTSFIARIRSDVAAPDMPFAIGKIHCPSCTYADTVRAAEDAVASDAPA